MPALAWGERLHDVVVRAAVQPGRDVAVLPARGQHDDRGSFRAERLADHRVAVLLRHHHVAHQEVRLVAHGRGQSFLPVARGRDLVAGAFQLDRDQAPDVLFVLDDQNALAHSAPFVSP